MNSAGFLFAHRAFRDELKYHHLTKVLFREDIERKVGGFAEKPSHWAGAIAPLVF